MKTVTTAHELFSFDEFAKARELIDRLAEHPVLVEVTTLPRVQKFMEYQVWCVWDFMMLLKTVQWHWDASPSKAVWYPSGRAMASRLINEIVLEEESDWLEEVGYISHFDFFVDAMKEAGADVERIETFIRLLQKGTQAFNALKSAEVPPASISFVRVTLALAGDGKESSEGAALGALFFGREALVPGMFRTLRSTLRTNRVPDVTKLVRYLERHCYLDRDRDVPSGPAAHENQLARLIRIFVDNQPDHRAARAEIARGGLVALTARRKYLDAILKEVRQVPV